MVAQFLKLLLQLALLHCISGRSSLIPKCYDQDSAIIVDSDKPKSPQKLRNELYYNIPVYKLVTPAPGIPKATARSTTPTPTIIDEYPNDLIDIARNKLGVKRMNQLPTVSELGKLLGTGNVLETIKYVRTLTSNDRGIALMQSYLKSLGYDLAHSGRESVRNYNSYKNFTHNADNEDTSDKLGIKTTIKPNFSANNLMQKYSAPGWLHGSTSHKSLLGNHLSAAPKQTAKQDAVSGLRPLFLRQPLPYHFPIPLRPTLMAQYEQPTTVPTILPTTTTNQNLPAQTSIHSQLNTDKAPSSATLQRVAPHVQQLAQIANVSPQMLDGFLHQQPKLAELAKRISRLPMVQQHSRVIDSQLLMAIKRALSQDEIFKRLLGASQTLN